MKLFKRKICQNTEKYISLHFILQIMDQQVEEIISTSFKLFQQLGIRNVSIDDVCSELRISKKTFYIHFKQKSDLVDAVITYNKEKEFAKYEKALRNKNAIESLIFIIREIKKNLDCEPHMMWHDIQKFYPKVYEKHEMLQHETIRSGFEDNLRKGIEEGYYREDLDIEMTSWFHAIQIKNTFITLQQSDVKFTKKRLLDFFIDLIVHLIANEKGLKYVEENYTKD